jgi:hypothetical protein
MGYNNMKCYKTRNFSDYTDKRKLVLNMRRVNNVNNK